MLRRMLAIFMATAFIFTTGSVAAAADECDDLPLIVVSGMDFTGLKLNFGEENQENAVKSFDVKALLGEIMRSAVKAILAGDRKVLISGIIDYVESVMGLLACDKNGNSKYNVSTVSYPLSVDNYDRFANADSGGNEFGVALTGMKRYGKNHSWFYVYDWRLSPLENCDGLNDMINLAIEQTGHKKVNVACCSMGGAVTVAYMTKYGYDKLNSCTSLSGAFSGTYVVTDLMVGDAYIDSKALMNYLNGVTGGKYRAVFSVLEKLGLVDSVSALGNKFIERNLEQVYDEFIIDTFATMPALWALVSPDRYEDAKEFIFGGREEEYSGVIEKADALQAMMNGRDDLFRRAIAQGVQMTFLANYNAPLIPAYKNAATQGDGTLETAMVSGGATVADLGETLSDEYISGRPAKYISPDKVIDASTCVFPDYTWFVKDAPHVATAYGTEYSEFVFCLIEHDGQPTINTFAQYPQFLASNAEQTIQPLK